MGFAAFDHKGKRYWMGVGNVRSCQYLLEAIEKGTRKMEQLEAFLARNAVSITTPAEGTFRHEFEQTFPAEQRIGFVGVPPTEVPAPTAQPEAKPENAAIIPGDPPDNFIKAEEPG